ncbi:phage terminase Nu1 subunit (DNA packaging protein) [Sinobacterium caligoides]|uniref:Phage terminase Nu1 subunit (DNA packaging protein) n=1 Tax=Sinobacterium caligoides TaxID=933926 RepID=A0A3N2E0T8_9GAMM|nr:terminase small subunit [Sinobacterium caligoides]ROS05718.1 phage terminase Nu1 subunit (DNA packaging protein) [Sinobacterium caligoides]
MAAHIEKLVSKSELCDLMGTTPPTVTKWVKQGMPEHSRTGGGKRAFYDVPVCLNWRLEHERKQAAGNKSTANREELELRKLRAEAEVVEVKAARMKGEVIELEHVRLVLVDVFTKTRGRIRKVGERVSKSLVGETNERTIKTLLLEEIDEALSIMAGDVGELLEPGEDDD